MTPTHQSDDLSEKAKERIDIAIALTVVALAAWMILHFGLFDYGSSDSQSRTSFVADNRLHIDTLTIDADTYVATTEDRVVPTAIAAPAAISRKRVTSIDPIAGTAAVTTYAPVKSDQPTTDEEQSSIIDTIATAVQNTASLDSTVMQNDSTTIVSAPSDDELAADTSIAEPEAATRSVEQSTAQTAVPNTDCVIVVGAYGRSSNARRMSQRLTEAGYNVFSTPHRNTTRVGVYQPCNSAQIQTVLRDIRANFASDATILVKSE